MTTKDFLALELKLAGADDAGAFTGLASTFNGVDKHGDTIAPGAYAKTLAEHKAAGTMPALLWGHDLREPIGVIDELSETPSGLAIKGRLAETQRGRDARTLAKMGAVTGLSIGFRTRKASTGPNGTRILEDIDLAEISWTPSPADPRARLASVKAADAAERADSMSTTQTGAAPEIAALEAKVESLAKDVKAATDRADALETQLARPAIHTKADDKTPEQKAFGEFLRGGLERVSEAKSLRVADDTAGGYLAPTQFVAEVIKGIVEFSPVRAAARVGSTGSGSVTIPRRTSTPTAGWVGETEDRPETQAAYGQVEIPVHELAAYTDVSVRLVEDAAVNVEAEIASDLGEQFGKVEGAAFVSGDGVKKPLGFMAAEGVAETLNGHATNLSADALINLFYAMPAAYRNRGAWMMAGPTLGVIRTLKDGQGNYIWRPGLAESAPETILGRPIAEAVDMPAVGAGSFPVAFGDFSRAFRIYDRVGLSILRDPYTLATRGMIRFHARRRVGAALVLKEAIRKLKMATS